MQQKRVTGAKECTWTSFGSLSPPKCHIFRQKSAKINFGMSLLHKIIGDNALRRGVKPVRTPVAILGSVGVCIYVPASRHWLISYYPIHLT